MVLICVASLGTFAVLPVFWTLPTSFLSGAAAAGGIAAINSIGNLSGYFGPTAMGWARDTTGSFSGGLLVIAALAVVAMVIVLVLQHDAKLEQAPGHGAQPAE